MSTELYELERGKEKGYPEVCPITRRKYFMELSTADGDVVPTYGGPFDSYTIPIKDDDGGWVQKRYDHDFGGWVDDEWLDEEYVNQLNPPQP